MAAHTDQTIHYPRPPRGVHSTSMPTRPFKENDQPVIQKDGAVNGLLYLVGMFFLKLLDLALLAFTQSAAHPMTERAYQQEGSYFYSETGDTLTTRGGESSPAGPNRFLNVGFTYNVRGVQLQCVSGSCEMAARILNEQSGWQQVLPMSQRSTFSGGAWFVASTLDLRQVEALVNSVERETGSRAAAYTIEIVTRVSFNGLVMGQYVMDSFEPVLAFKFDKVRLYPLKAGGRNDPMLHSKPGPLAGPVPGWARRRRSRRDRPSGMVTGAGPTHADESW